MPLKDHDQSMTERSTSRSRIRRKQSKDYKKDDL
jgi:hypothetical protein